MRRPFVGLQRGYVSSNFVQPLLIGSPGIHVLGVVVHAFIEELKNNRQTVGPVSEASQGP